MKVPAAAIAAQVSRPGKAGAGAVPRPRTRPPGSPAAAVPRGHRRLAVPRKGRKPSAVGIVLTILVFLQSAGLGATCLLVILGASIAKSQRTGSGVSLGPAQEALSSAIGIASAFLILSLIRAIGGVGFLMKKDWGRAFLVIISLLEAFILSIGTMAGWGLLFAFMAVFDVAFAVLFATRLVHAAPEPSAKVR